MLFFQNAAYAARKPGEPLYCQPNEGSVALVVNGNLGRFTVDTDCYGNNAVTTGLNQIVVPPTQGTMTNDPASAGQYFYAGMGNPNFTGTDTFTIHVTTSWNSLGGAGGFSAGSPGAAGDVVVTLNVLPSTISASATGGQPVTIPVPPGSIAGCSAPGNSGQGPAPGAVYGCVTGASIGTIAAAHGTTVFTPGSMSFKYTPSASFGGTDTFTIQALGATNDGNTAMSSGDITVTVTVAAAPSANAVAINGTPQIGGTVAGSYTYASITGATQGNSTFRWMSGSTADGSDRLPISGATSASYKPTIADGGNYLFFCVTPVAVTAPTTGAETCSPGSLFAIVPNISTPTAVTGIGPNQVAPLDLSGGYGPTLTNCLVPTLSQLLGPNAVYMGQISGGGTRVSQGGSIISFYALRARGSSQGSGIRLLATNALNVGTGCGNLDVAPALFNPTEFGLALTGMGLSASINATGVITVVGNGSVYVVRPDYVVTPGQPVGTGLKLGADGLYRFTDSAGNSQVLRPAFLSPSALQSAAGAALGGLLVIQTDGTALFTQINGAQSVLSPDMILGPIPAAFATSTWWSDATNHYRFALGLTSQGLTRTAK